MKIPFLFEGKWTVQELLEFGQKLIQEPFQWFLSKLQWPLFIAMGLMLSTGFMHVIQSAKGFQYGAIWTATIPGIFLTTGVSLPARWVYLLVFSPIGWLFSTLVLVLLAQLLGWLNERGRKKSGARLKGEPLPGAGTGAACISFGFLIPAFVEALGISINAHGWNLISAAAFLIILMLGGEQTTPQSSNDTDAGQE